MGTGISVFHGLGMNRRALRRGISAAALGIALAPALAVPAHSEVPVSSVTERLNWHGDPKAPDISGVWVRSGATGETAANKEGWMPWPAPLKPPLAATYAQRVADAAGKRADDPVRGCMPPGMPRFMTGTNGPMMILQTPGQVSIYRDGIPIRRIWTDGRALPAPKDLESFSNGNAIGQYEGKDLVTQVAGITNEPIDSTGIPHSDALTIAERFHRVNATTLRVELTLTDPTAYAAPMTSTVTYTASKDKLWAPKDFLCTPRTDYHPDKYVH